MCKYSSLVTRVTSPCPHMGMVIYTTAMTVDGHSLLLIRLLLVGHSGHRCGCFVKYNCTSCWRVLLATSQAAPCWVLQHWCSCSESWGALMLLHQWGLLPKGKLQRTQLSMSSISSRAYSATHMNKSNNSRPRVAATLFLLYWSPSQECHHSCPITKGVTKVTRHWMTNGTQGARIILDPFLEHPEFGLLLAECQCPQSNFRTGQIKKGNGRDFF